MELRGGQMLAKMFDLSGKTAIVPGASYGLGVTFAEALASAGANVVLSARSKDKLEAAARRIADGAHRAVSIACDVGEPAEVRNLVDEACRQFGRVDILVNNAGIAADFGCMPEKIPDP